MRRLIVLNIPWTTALIQQTTRLKEGWGSMFKQDWNWLQQYGDPHLPAVEDFDNFRLFLSSTPKTRWTALLKKARARNLGLQRIQADRETLDRFQTAVFRKFGNADVDEQGPS